MGLSVDCWRSVDGFPIFAAWDDTNRLARGNYENGIDETDALNARAGTNLRAYLWSAANVGRVVVSVFAVQTHFE